MKISQKWELRLPLNRGIGKLVLSQKYTFARSLLLPRMQAATLLSTIAKTNAIFRLKLTFPTTYFTGKKVISAIGKCREFLITAYRTTCNLYQQFSALQKHCRPVGKIIIEDVQKRFDSSMLTKAIHQRHK